VIAELRIARNAGVGSFFDILLPTLPIEHSDARQRYLSIGSRVDLGTVVDWVTRLAWVIGESFGSSPMMTFYRQAGEYQPFEDTKPQSWRPYQATNELDVTASIWVGGDDFWILKPRSWEAMREVLVPPRMCRTAIHFSEGTGAKFLCCWDEETEIFLGGDTAQLRSIVEEVAREVDCATTYVPWSPEINKEFSDCSRRVADARRALDSLANFS